MLEIAKSAQFEEPCKIHCEKQDIWCIEHQMFTCKQCVTQSGVHASHTFLPAITINSLLQNYANLKMLENERLYFDWIYEKLVSFQGLIKTEKNRIENEFSKIENDTIFKQQKDVAIKMSAHQQFNNNEEFKTIKLLLERLTSLEYELRVCLENHKKVSETHSIELSKMIGSKMTMSLDEIEPMLEAPKNQEQIEKYKKIHFQNKQSKELILLSSEKTRKSAQSFNKEFQLAGATISICSRLFAIGGLYSQGGGSEAPSEDLPSKEIFEFDLPKSQLIRKGYMNYCRYSDFGLVAKGSVLYIIGGHPLTKTCEMFDIQSNNGCPLPELQVALKNPGVIDWNQQIQIIGGETKEYNKFLNTIQRLNTINLGKWEQVDFEGWLNGIRNPFVCLIDENAVLIAGGGKSQENQWTNKLNSQNESYLMTSNEEKKIQIAKKEKQYLPKKTWFPTEFVPIEQNKKVFIFDKDHDCVVFDKELNGWSFVSYNVWRTEKK